MNKCTPAQARELADRLEKASASKLVDDSATALHSLVDQVEALTAERDAVTAMKESK